MEPRVSAHGSVIHMTFKQPRCHSLPVHPSLTGHILLGFFRLLSMFYLKLPLFFLLSALQEISSLPPFVSVTHFFAHFLSFLSFHIDLLFSTLLQMSFSHRSPASGDPDAFFPLPDALKCNKGGTVSEQ